MAIFPGFRNGTSDARWRAARALRGASLDESRTLVDARETLPRAAPAPRGFIRT